MLIILFGELEVDAAEGFMGIVVWIQRTSSSKRVRSMRQRYIDVKNATCGTFFINGWMISTNECLSHILLWSHYYHLAPFTHVFVLCSPHLEKKTQIIFKLFFFFYKLCWTFRREWMFPGAISHLPVHLKWPPRCLTWMGILFFRVAYVWFDDCRSAAHTPVPFFFCFFLFL